MSKGSEGRRPICSRELGVVIYGAELPATSDPREKAVPGPRRRDPWRRDVKPRRHDAWRRPPRSISAFKFSRGPIVNFFQKKDQIVKNWARATAPRAFVGDGLQCHLGRAREREKERV